MRLHDWNSSVGFAGAPMCMLFAAVSVALLVQDQQCLYFTIGSFEDPKYLAVLGAGIGGYLWLCDRKWKLLQPTMEA